MSVKRPLPSLRYSLFADARPAGEPDVEVETPVGVRIAPRRGARVGQIRHAGLGRDLDERAAIVAVQTVRDAVLEADEQIEIAVVVVVGPATRLAAGRGEQVRLHELEARRRRRRSPT